MCFFRVFLILTGLSLGPSGQKILEPLVSILARTLGRFKGSQSGTLGHFWGSFQNQNLTLTLKLEIF